jgi:hypothetical protein
MNAFMLAPHTRLILAVTSVITRLSVICTISNALVYTRLTAPAGGTISKRAVYARLSDTVAITVATVKVALTLTNSLVTHDNHRGDC